MSAVLPTWEEFEKAADGASIVALSTTMNFDLETAISLAERFVEEDHFFLLESATPGPGGLSRYSFLGFDPLAVFSSSDGNYHWSFGGSVESGSLKTEDPLAILAERFKSLSLSVCKYQGQRQDVIDLCFNGGLVGYVSYEAAKYFEPGCQSELPRAFGLPEIFYMIPKNFMILDQLSRKLIVVRYCAVDAKLSKEQLRVIFESENKSFAALLNRISKIPRTAELRVSDEQIAFEKFRASVTHAEFLEYVTEGLKQIRQGEIYQIQLGNRLSKDTSAHPFDVFRHLRLLNPSPYMAFYKTNAHHIICASPEMMVNVLDGKVVHRPIAGTRKRSWDSAKDVLVKQELQSDEKERAEHVMLVDLARNDVGRIAKPGSVNVDELMIVEEYSHVFHLVSQVSGGLLDAEDAFTALRASFPNGTVTGAPKIRSMQLISSIEPLAREFYAGSLGIFDFQGNLRSTLLIRTIYMGEGIAATQASAGIVYDSIPEHEWLETRNKMAACLLAIQNTKPRTTS